MAYVYIVECRDGTLYTGWTTDIERRVSQHNKGEGAKYTRARRPVVLKYFEEFDTNREAMKRECEIKKLSRQDKIKLFDYN
ncbi:TPA: GIY-YIG nuclease family protein [Clostridium botulinum]|nr:GIY-YIG nuclease family protein [Clostridium botulinum]